MKCLVHPDREGIGICISCGRALCIDCKVAVDGKLYCKECLETGRASLPNFGAQAVRFQPMNMPQTPQMYYPGFRPPVQSVARKLSPESRTLYLVGGAGAIVSAVIGILMGIMVMYIYLNQKSTSYGSSYGYISVLPIEWMYVLFVLATAFVITYFIRSPAAIVSYVFSLIGAILFLSILIVGVIYGNGRIYDNSYSGSYSYVDGIVLTTTFWFVPIMLGIASIVGGAMLIVMKRYAAKPILTNAAGIMMIIGGSLLTAIIGIIGVGLFLLAVGDILFGTSLFIDATHTPEEKKSDTTSGDKA
jgi:hypothetical protein